MSVEGDSPLVLVERHVEVTGFGMFWWWDGEAEGMMASIRWDAQPQHTTQRKPHLRFDPGKRRAEATVH